MSEGFECCSIALKTLLSLAHARCKPATFETSQVLHGLAHGILSALAILMCVQGVLAIDFPWAKKKSDKTWYICLIEFDICCDFVVRSEAYEHANKNIWQRNKSMKPRWPTRTSLEAMNCPGSMSRNAWFTVTKFFGYRSFC